MQIIRITKPLCMRGMRTGSLSAVRSWCIKNSKEALKSVYLLLPAVNISLMSNKPHRRRRKSYQQITEFAQGSIISVREGGFSYRENAACTQCNATTVIHIWKKWTEENQARWKPGSWMHNSTGQQTPYTHGCDGLSRVLPDMSLIEHVWDFIGLQLML